MLKWKDLINEKWEMAPGTLPSNDLVYPNQETGVVIREVDGLFNFEFYINAGSLHEAAKALKDYINT